MSTQVNAAGPEMIEILNRLSDGVKSGSSTIVRLVLTLLKTERDPTEVVNYPKWESIVNLVGGSKFDAIRELFVKFLSDLDSINRNAMSGQTKLGEYNPEMFAEGSENQRPANGVTPKSQLLFDSVLPDRGVLCRAQGLDEEQTTGHLRSVGLHTIEYVALRLSLKMGKPSSSLRADSPFSKGG